MGRPVGALPLRCEARIHALVEDGRLLRLRCKDKTCPDVQQAKARGLKVFHVYDLDTFDPGRGTYLNWPEYEPDDRRETE